MYLVSHGINFLSSPNLKYFAFYHNNKIYIYRERTFIDELEVKGLDIKINSISDKGELLALQNNLLVLYTYQEKQGYQPVSLNSYFKEGGSLQNFALLPNQTKIFFTRKSQDKSIFSKLTRKETTIQELNILNLSNKKEEVLLTKKVEKEEDFYIFKLSPHNNYILIADPQKMIIQKINLVNYVEELSLSIENIEITDFFINNEGDCCLILKEENKSGIYFVGKNTKQIIKTNFTIDDYTIINFNPSYFILKNKSYPEVIIIDRNGNKYLEFDLNDIDSLGYPFWAILFPNYEDIITIYLKQFKLPTDIFFYTYSTFKIESVRWKAASRKTKVEEKKQNQIIYSFLYEEKTTTQKEQTKEQIKEQLKEEEIKNQEEIIPKIQETELQNEIKQSIDETVLTKKVLEEIKSESKQINYDPSSFLKFLEESENQENSIETPTKPSKLKLEEIIQEKNLTKPQEEKTKKEIPKEIKIQIPEEKTKISSEKPNKIEKEETIPKTQSTPIDIEKILSKVETKIEKTEKKIVQNIIAENLENEEISIEIKKELSKEDFNKLEEQKNEIMKKINELKFLKSIGELSNEEYEKKLNELKKALEEVKQKLAKLNAT